MRKIIPSDIVYVAKSDIPKAGLGVFASGNIKSRKIIETCPTLVLPRKDYPLVKKTIIRNYHFMWGKSNSAICFGYGSIYNHSYNPNATYKKNVKDQTIEFIALRDIKDGEEITVNYNYGKHESRKKLWIKEIVPAK